MFLEALQPSAQILGLLQEDTAAAYKVSKEHSSTQTPLLWLNFLQKVGRIYRPVSKSSNPQLKIY